MKLGLLMWMTTLMPQPLADQTCLAATVYLEARSESMRGQMAVAEVGLRRLEQRRWGDNLCQVLTARGQFALSITSKNYQIDNVDAWNNAWSVASAALNVWALPEDLRMLVVPGANHFLASYANQPSWAAGRPLMVIGEHRFYAVN
ncbi:cell wall hydrolase [Tahibacter amnicola]|uniref:Cell wall hydrolase n=1 Tax=Tahibacter amnicola TaxID=2976241 RepID=A0ABY6BAY7_9GAMM|nr:cell wall hydrolase [Tahibacter amnicola]UXI66697.1 cell wall hydrolase [Tahibacter amnicola]